MPTLARSLRTTRSWQLGPRLSSLEMEPSPEPPRAVRPQAMIMLIEDHPQSPLQVGTGSCLTVL